MPNPFNYPTFMDRSDALTGGAALPMPDTEFGSEGPILELFISKLLRAFAKERALNEQTGYTEQERENMLKGYEQHLPTPFGYPAEFDTPLYEPEEDLLEAKRATKMGFPSPSKFKPVRPWDMREF